MKHSMLFSLLMAALLTIGSTGLTQAQVALRPYAGVNISQLSKALIEDSSWKSRLGYQVGADVQIGEKFFVQPGIQFEAFRNLKRFTLPVIGDQEVELTRSYLRIPLMVGYRFGDFEDTFGFRVFAGPNAAFNISGNTDELFDGASLDENLETVVFGVGGGIGVDFLSILFLDLGYQAGLTDVFEDIDAIAGFNSGAKNHFFYANVGVKISF